MLDFLDRKIIYELSINSRVAVSVLAKKLRTSPETVNFRIKRLLKEKYIKGFYTLLNLTKAGYFYYNVFLKLHHIPSDTERELIEWIRHQKHLAKLRIYEGKYTVGFIAIVKSPKVLARCLVELKHLFGKWIIETEIHLIIKTHVFNHRNLFQGKVESITFQQDLPEHDLLDKTDKRIVQLLATNARIKNLELGSIVNVHPKVIAYRIKRMEAGQIIVGYACSPNFEKFPFEFIQLNIRVKTAQSIPSIIEFFNVTNKCFFAFELLGSYDVLLELHVENDIVL